jgi:hypothetical protein
MQLGLKYLDSLCGSDSCSTPSTSRKIKGFERDESAAAAAAAVDASG